MTARRDHHAVPGVPKTASTHATTEACRVLVRDHHRDSNAGDTTGAS